MYFESVIMRTIPKLEDACASGLIPVGKRSAWLCQSNLKGKMAMVLKPSTPNSLFCKEKAGLAVHHGSQTVRRGRIPSIPADVDGRERC